MFYAIFDIRPQHSSKPYMFHLEKGETKYAVYHTKEKANAVCENWNSTSTLTSYIVKEITAGHYYNLIFEKNH